MDLLGEKGRRNYPKKDKEGYDKLGMRNQKMDDEVYKRRRIVMDQIYAAKNLLRKHGVNLPRINVKIVDVKPDSVYRRALGMATLANNEIYIPASTLNGPYKNLLKHVVYHEILHAAFDIRHFDDSPLMSPYARQTPDEEIDRLFIEHVLQPENFTKPTDDIWK